METVNGCSMQLLCLLISPQGWATLRLYSFTTTDGLMYTVCGFARSDPQLSARTIFMNIRTDFLSHDANNVLDERCMLTFFGRGFIVAAGPGVRQAFQ